MNNYLLVKFIETQNLVTFDGTMFWGISINPEFWKYPATIPRWENIEHTLVVDDNVVLCSHVIRNVMIHDQSEKSVE